MLLVFLTWEEHRPQTTLRTHKCVKTDRLPTLDLGDRLHSVRNWSSVMVSSSEFGSVLRVTWRKRLGVFLGVNSSSLGAAVNLCCQSARPPAAPRHHHHHHHHHHHQCSICQKSSSPQGRERGWSFWGGDSMLVNFRCLHSIEILSSYHLQAMCMHVKVKVKVSVFI